MLKAMKKMKPVKKILFAILIGFAVVMFWRGVWGLVDEYFLPNNYRLSLWLSLAVGLLILLATHYVTEELM